MQQESGPGIFGPRPRRSDPYSATTLVVIHGVLSRRTVASGTGTSAYAAHRLASIMPHTFDPPELMRPLAFRLRRLGLAAGVSIALGYAWVIGLTLLGAGDPTDAVSSISGVVAGLAAGMFTVWSRSRRQGREWWPYLLLTLYVGILVYWSTLFVLEDVPDMLRHGVDDGVIHNITVTLLDSLIFGTVPLGIVLLPACFASRWLVWRTYCGPAGA